MEISSSAAMLAALVMLRLALPRRIFFAHTSMVSLLPSSAPTAKVPATSATSGTRKLIVSSMVRSPVALTRSAPASLRTNLS